MPRLSDTQSILLAHAAQRRDGSLFPLPDTLSSSGAGVAKSITALVKHGLAEERETSDATCVRRSDGDLRFGVFVTTAGLAAIGIVEDDAVTPPTSTSPAPANPVTAPTLPGARSTKSAAVVALLARDGGATLAELITATGWLPHTNRAALTGLRKKGHAVLRCTRDGATCYTIGAVA